MSRLLPNLGRSSKENTRNEYAYYEGYDPSYAQNGYDPYDEHGFPRQPPRPPSAWRRAFSKRSKTGGKAYYGEGETPGFQRSRSHRAADGYPDGRSGLPYVSSDDTESYVNIPSRNHSPVPIVQRESSLSRLQEAFADHGTYSPATLDPTTPMRGTPRYSPQQMPMPMPAAFDVGTVHEARHEPHIVSNTPFEGIRPDVMQMSGRRRERPTYDSRPSIEIYNHQPEQWNQRGFDDGYPPVVVVVQRGEYGEKDTYYIVPGGAPVIFEDDDGNEITRIGDFSGNYRPRPLRPVIVEDEYGREICRAGFDGDYPSRSRGNEGYYGSGQRSGHRIRSSRRDPRYDEGYSSSYRPHRSREYDEYDDRDYRPGQSYDYHRSDPSPNVVFVDPSESSSSGRRSADILHRTGTRTSHRDDYRDDYYLSGSRQQRYGSPSFVEQDPYQRRHGSNGSSRSGGSSNRGFYGHP